MDDRLFHSALQLGEHRKLNMDIFEATHLTSYKTVSCTYVRELRELRPDIEELTQLK